MTVSVIEVALANFNTNSTTAAPTLSATPAGGDVIAVVFDLRVSATTNGTAINGLGVSGCGATWSQKDTQSVASNGSAAGHFHGLWFGTGANASGAISASWTTNALGTVRAFLIRGLSANTVAAVSNGTISNVSGTYTGPSSNAQLGQIVLDAQFTSLASTTNGQTFSATTPSGWTTQTEYKPGTNGKWNTGYRIPTETSATSHRSDLSNAGFSGNARITQWVIGDAAASSTTVALPVAAGLAFAALAVAKTTVGLAVSAGMSFVASSVVQTTVALPVQVGLSFEATSFEAGQTTVEMPVSAGLSFEASAVARSTVDMPVTVGMSFAASKTEPTTVEMPVSVGLSFTASSGATSFDMPVTVGMSFAASGGDTLIPEWTVEQSQAALLNIQIPGGPITVLPPIAGPPPVPFVERMLTRQSHLLPSLTPDANHRVRALGDHDIITENIGTPHLFVSGRDVTYFRDVPVLIGEWSASLPGGDETASVEFPQISPWEQAGVGDLSWLKPDAPAEIWLCKDGARVGRCQFAGHLVSDNPSLTETDMRGGWHLEGAIAQADHQGHRVPILLEPTDIGTLIAKDLNDVVSRRWATVQPVTTGILTRKRGAYGDTTLDYTSELLSTAWTDDARQWTVKRGTQPRTFQIGLKKPTDGTVIDHVITFGAPGIEVDLTYDGGQVINTVYGRGVAPNGYSWAGWCHPYLHPDNSPVFPFSDPDAFMTVGTTDAETTSGEGVSVWQDRVRSLGLKDIEVDGTFRADDAAAALEIQRRNGLLEDSLVGAQTWAATFAIGTNVGTLDGSYRRALAIRPEVAVYLHAANGAVTGPNPAYNPNLIRREIDIDFGAGVTKAEATRTAWQIIGRNTTPGWAGRITMRTDPHGGHRFDIFEGDNIKVLGFRGTDTLIVQVADISKSHDGTVTVTVDTKARDAMTLSSILERDRDARIDPAMRPGNVNRRSRGERDMAVEFDGESGGGIIPRLAVHAGLWTVIPIPVSQVGQMNLITAQTSGPVAKYAMAVFGAPIQPTHLNRYVGNPLASDNPYAANADTLLDRFNFIDGWGQQGNACGYSRKSEGSGPLTGLFEDAAGFSYSSWKGNWLWVAIYSPTSCFIRGRMWPAPVV